VRRAGHRLTVALATLIFAGVVAACSSSGGGAAPSNGASAGSTGTSSAAAANVASAKAFFVAHATPTSFSGGTPFKPPTGKHIGVVSCDQGNPACADIAQAAQQAGDVLGWTTTVVDGKGTVVGFNEGMQQLIQDHVDGIFLDAIPDDAVVQGLNAAFAAHIPVISLGAGTLLSAPVQHPSIASIDQPYALMGQMQGDFMVMASNGTAKAAFMEDNQIPALEKIETTAIGVLKACTGCTVDATVEVGTPTNFTSSGAAQTQALLSRFPKGELDYIVPLTDGMTSGVTQALTAAGRTDVKNVSDGCTPGLTPGLDQMFNKSGPTVYCTTPPNDWYSWAGVDQMARHFANLPVHNIEIGVSFWTLSTLPSNNATSVAPGSAYYPFNWVTYYKKLWGITT
jgi:ribose transport system substrate-binding protein